MEIFSAYLPFIIQLPLIIVWIVGIILASKIKEQNKRVSMLVASSLITALLGSVVAFIVHANVLSQFQAGNLDIDALTISNTIIQIAEMLTQAASFILLLLAIFKAKKTNSQPKND